MRRGRSKSGRKRGFDQEQPTKGGTLMSHCGVWSSWAMMTQEVVCPRPGGLEIQGLQLLNRSPLSYLCLISDCANPELPWLPARGKLRLFAVPIKKTEQRSKECHSGTKISAKKKAKSSTFESLYRLHTKCAQ